MMSDRRDRPEGVREFAACTDSIAIHPARVLVFDDNIMVEMAGFSTRLARPTTRARHMPNDPNPGGPVHDPEDETSWRYTTSHTGIVELTTSPPAEGWMSVAVAGRRIRISSLLLSLVDAKEFVDLIEGSRRSPE